MMSCDSAGKKLSNCVRVLNEQDFEAVKGLIERRAEQIKRRRGIDILSGPYSWIDRIEKNLDSCVYNRILYGYYVDGILTSMLGQLYWSDLPYSTFVFLFTQPGKKYKFCQKRQGVELLFDLAVKEAEGRDIFTHYSCKPLRAQRGYSNYNWHWGSMYYQERYIEFTETIIPAFNRPIYSVYWDFMEQVVWPEDLIVRKATLREECRLSILREKIPVRQRVCVNSFNG